MDEVFILSVVISILVIVLCGLYFTKSKSSSRDEKERSRRRAAIPTRGEDGQIVQNQEMLVAAGPRGRRGARMQRRPQVAANTVEENENDNLSDEDNEDNAPKKIEGKIGKKKMEKLQVFSNNIHVILKEILRSLVTSMIRAIFSDGLLFSNIYMIGEGR